MLQVYYDPKETNYSALLDCFFDHVDPTTLNQQGNDRGTQYRSGIYYHNEEQKAAAGKVSAYVLCKIACVIYNTPPPPPPPGLGLQELTGMWTVS